MLSFNNTLIGIGPICNAVCYVTFTKHSVTIFNPQGHPILTGWRDHTVTPKLCRFALQPHATHFSSRHADNETALLTVSNAYDLPSVGVLVVYLHLTAGFPFKYTWLEVIKASLQHARPNNSWNQKKLSRATYGRAAKVSVPQSPTPPIPPPSTPPSPLKEDLESSDQNASITNVDGAHANELHVFNKSIIKL